MTFTFRAKTDNDTLWCYGLPLYNLDTGLPTNLISFLGPREFRVTPILPDSLGLCSDFHDVNNREIAQGDIVRVSGSFANDDDIREFVAVIRFENDALMIRSIVSDFSYPLFEAFSPNSQIKIEIIGNTTDNPEFFTEPNG